MIIKNKKRGNENFDIPMGWCNRAEMFGLLNYQLLNLLKNIIAKKQPVIVDMMSWEFSIIFQKHKLHENLLYLKVIVCVHQYTVQI